MNFKLNTILVVFLMMMGIINAQTDIDYTHKSLIKTLNKSGILDAKMSEINISDSIKIQHKIKGKYFIINDSNTLSYKYIYIGRVNSCRKGGCSNPSTNSTNDYEYFDYFIIYDDKKTIRNVKVFNYQALYGYEITSKGWLKQFIGYDGSNYLKVNKNVDAISGATISVIAITLDIENKTNILKSF